MPIKNVCVMYVAFKILVKIPMSPKFEDPCFCRYSEWPVWWRGTGRALWGRESSGKVWKTIHIGKVMREKGEGVSGLSGSPEEFSPEAWKGEQEQEEAQGLGRQSPVGPAGRIGGGLGAFCGTGGRAGVKEESKGRGHPRPPIVCGHSS